MNEKEILNWDEYWEEYSEFWLEEMVLEAAEANCKEAWIDDCRSEVARLVKAQTGYDNLDPSWVREALHDTNNVEQAAAVLVDLVGELDAPETAHNTPTLSAYDQMVNRLIATAVGQDLAGRNH